MPSTRTRSAARTRNPSASTARKPATKPRGAATVSARRAAMPTVAEFMSRHAVTIGADQTLAAAHAAMRSHAIRHLPVLRAGHLVGLVSERDLHLVETLRDVNPDEVLVEEAMTQDPLTIVPDAPLIDAAIVMVRGKAGSIVVVDRSGELVGILTTIDALRALTVLLAQAA